MSEVDGGQQGQDTGAARPSEDVPRFPVVGIGASAGGLEALEALIRRLSASGMSYVVVQHLAPGHESLLAEILSRCAVIRVVTITDQMPVAPDTLYVVPPGANVTLWQGLFRVAPHEEIPRHSIDVFFRSLAAERGVQAIGVVLSGAGNDGTLGLRAIRDEGGITLVQDPSTAQQPSMPQSALDAGYADYCLAPEAIGDELMRLAAHPLVARKRPARLFAQEVLEGILEQVHRRFGIDFTGYKLATVERRLERRLALQKLESARDYLAYLEDHPGELKALYADLLIGVTSFFRDREVFDLLQTVVFRRLLQDRNPDQPIRIWVPGCATGEEAYSIAMCLLEVLDGRAGYRIQIFGTDVNEDSLARARQGLYPATIEVDVPAGRLQRFFTRHEKGYQIAQSVRDMVVFARHVLGRDPPFSRLDLVSCRNVLIYLQPPLQKRVLRVFHYALNPDGFLLLGTSESVGDAVELFTPVDQRLKLYARKNALSVPQFTFGPPRYLEAASGTPSAGVQGAADRRPRVSMQQLADRKVLDKFGPPGLLVDEGLDVIQFRGQVGPYLAPSPGTASLHLLKLVRPELLLELRSALQRARTDGMPASSPPVSLGSGPGAPAVTLEVLPLFEASGAERCLLVLFRESAVLAAPADSAARPPPPPAGDESRVQVLERELFVTKEYLQATVSELESSNEELQSANEELQSANEELQSTNEELETSKEELQSTNEELSTVNEELRSRMGQLSVSNDDLQNLLTTVSSPVLLVDLDLRIRRFSASAEKLLNLIPGDMGRPIGYLESALNAPNLTAGIAETLGSLQETARRVRCADGLWYTVRAVPYRTADHAIRGAVVEFVRVPPPRAPETATEITEVVGRVLSSLPQVLMLLDDHLRLVWVNKAFFDTFLVGAEVLGRSLDEVWPERAKEAALGEALEQVVSGGKPFRELLIRHPFGRRSDQPMRFSARRLLAEADGPALTLVIMEEAP